ncbi:hypothetical protein Pcinc_007294 [Petrolisthes cinctipes]|uniref:Fucosyltransferase n=1 Tax=Petrolisthes cinctipes TaxID=88211 RepID=A0AAE1KX31_PETCI|nr:hypothetical protein Pcinc_007294 [Petrolisthes cinctipes]
MRLKAHKIQPQIKRKRMLFFGEDWNNVFEYRANLTSCPVQTCTFFQQSHNPENADALIFHQADYDPGKVPALRRQNQIYIWMTLEAPSIPKVASKLSRKQKKQADNLYGYNDFFNWTATYHHNSEVFIPYGRLESLNGETYTHTGDMYQSYLADLDQTDLPNTWTTHHNRTKMAAWMVSHCGTDSGRELYVKELRQYINVDIYGKCGKLVCGKNHNDEFCYTDVLAPTYKFYLAFENKVCQDYLTEKVWLPLKHGLVPVVYGGADYSIFLPPHSYIDATHLTPNQLAKLLISVASSPREYTRYHLWRRYWRVSSTLPLCELCEKLHEEDSTRGRHYTRKHEKDSKRGRQYTMRKLHKEDGTSERRNLVSWWWKVNNCTTNYPYDHYVRPPEPHPPDNRTFLQKLKDGTRLLAGLVNAISLS